MRVVAPSDQLDMAHANRVVLPIPRDQYGARRMVIPPLRRIASKLIAMTDADDLHAQRPVGMRSIPVPIAHSAASSKGRLGQGPASQEGMCYRKAGPQPRQSNAAG
jgi:hypothetical protein